MGHRIFLLALLLASGFYTFLARRIPMDPWTARELINARTLPTVYGILLAITLLLLILRPPAASAAAPGGRYVRGVGTGMLILGFIALTGAIDLWVALAGLLFATGWWLGERRWRSLLALSLAVPLLGYIGIELGLGVYLPDR